MTDRPRSRWKKFWSTTDRWMRKLHLWTGLFLVPWMIIYAASALFINHPILNKVAGSGPPKWKQLRTIDFTPDDSFPADPKAQAARIVELVDLEGAHRIQGKPNANQLTVFRISGAGHYRIVWNKRQHKIVVARQDPFSAVRLVHFLHFRAGFRQRYPAFITWAFVVDAVVLSILLWVVSGVYLWARMPKVRVSGAICLGAGLALFVVLVLMLSD